ncbi:MAG: 4'-phosphopantetheinyl transferase superfamily protein [Rikenellaceae bacterium]|jgi:4'-phosphopantetheinyl transferase EntD|nr:4'-phosphopantetheinyl transferase superfamily protein [Rikenellaceae bacterium]
MNSAWLEVRPASTDLEALREWVTPEEWEAAAMNSTARRSEWLTWRALVRQRLGRDVAISYDTQGAPIVDKGCIGVSHTRGWVAVVWSAEPCAVDIELTARAISSVTARRFISPEERALPDSTNPLFPVAVWCAKEAAYKFAHAAGLVARTADGLDFLKELRITSSDLSAGKMSVSISGIHPLEIQLLRTSTLLLAVIA